MIFYSDSVRDKIGYNMVRETLVDLSWSGARFTGYASTCAL
jgi:hypothetical protein